MHLLSAYGMMFWEQLGCLRALYKNDSFGECRCMGCCVCFAAKESVGRPRLPSGLRFFLVGYGNQLVEAVYGANKHPRCDVVCGGRANDELRMGADRCYFWNRFVRNLCAVHLCGVFFVCFVSMAVRTK